MISYTDEKQVSPHVVVLNSKLDIHHAGSALSWMTASLFYAKQREKSTIFDEIRYLFKNCSMHFIDVSRYSQCIALEMEGEAKDLFSSFLLPNFPKQISEGLIIMLKHYFRWRVIWSVVTSYNDFSLQVTHDVILESGRECHSLI